MEDTTNVVITKTLTGRTKIYVNRDITEETVMSELNGCLIEHFKNVMDIQYLYDYSKGNQPILFRHKDKRPEICNKVVVNVASEIESFKNGYFLTKPAFYVSRREDSELADEISTLNDYLYTSGKHEADNELVAWFHKVGIAHLFVESDEDEAFKCYPLDPRTAFVGHSRKPSGEAAMGVHNVKYTNEKGDIEMRYDVFTKEYIFHLKSNAYPSDHKFSIEDSFATELISVEPNALGEIPIIEYVYNRNRMSAFEPALSLLDQLNNIMSNRADGVEQFIQSLLVLTNCTLGTDEEGNPIGANTIRENGLLELKSVGTNPAKVDIIAEQLDQTQTQVLIDNLTKSIFDICGVPQNTPTRYSSSDNTGAVYLRNGWQSADSQARNTEDLFHKSNKIFDRIVLKILNRKEKLKLKPSDIALQFSRSETENMLVKTQVALNLKALGMSPELVYERSGITNDPVGDVAKSKEYAKLAFTLPEAENITPETMDMQSSKENIQPAGNTPSAAPTDKPKEDNNGKYWISGYWR